MNYSKKIVDELVDLYNDYTIELAEEMRPYKEELELIVDSEYDGDIRQFIKQNLQNSDYYYLTDFVKNLYYSEDVLSI